MSRPDIIQRPILDAARNGVTPRVKPMSDRGFLHLPSTDVAELFESLGVLGLRGPSLVQYVAWSDKAGIFSTLASKGTATAAEISSTCNLTPKGTQKLLTLLGSLGLVHQSPESGYTLSEMAAAYLVKGGPHYVGPALYNGVDQNIPLLFGFKNLTGRHKLREKLFARFNQMACTVMRRFFGLGSPHQLQNQQARNSTYGLAAVRTGLFAGVKHMVDIGGGTGTFSIPFACDYPDKKVTLVDLKEGLPNIRKYLERYGVEDKVELLGLDILQKPWKLPECDGIFLGNVLHGFPDQPSLMFLEESFRCLPPGGIIGIQEMLLDENKEGPLLPAFWNATYDLNQRTFGEIEALLKKAGFVELAVTPLRGRFSLITAKKPLTQ
jgi:ubiquinone/menaquinone biosynthesis C-methylase UbiE